MSDPFTRFREACWDFDLSPKPARVCPDPDPLSVSPYPRTASKPPQWRDGRLPQVASGSSNFPRRRQPFCRWMRKNAAGRPSHPSGAPCPRQVGRASTIGRYGQHVNRNAGGCANFTNQRLAGTKRTTNTGQREPVIAHTHRRRWPRITCRTGHKMSGEVRAVLPLVRNTLCSPHVLFKPVDYDHHSTEDTARLSPCPVSALRRRRCEPLCGWWLLWL